MISHIAVYEMLLKNYLVISKPLLETDILNFLPVITSMTLVPRNHGLLWTITYIRIYEQ